jgi:hypothetical protein
MTSTSFPPALASDHERARSATVPVGVVTLGVAAFLSVTGANSTGEWIFEVAVQVVAAGLLFGLAVPRGLRHESAGKRALAMALAGALLVVPAFWLGLSPLLAAAAVLLGYAGKQATRGSGPATAGLVLGLLTLVAYLAIYASDYLSTHGNG